MFCSLTRGVRRPLTVTVNILIVTLCVNDLVNAPWINTGDLDLLGEIATSIYLVGIPAVYNRLFLHAPIRSNSDLYGRGILNVEFERVCTCTQRRESRQRA